MPVHSLIPRLINRASEQWIGTLPIDQQSRVRGDFDIDRKATQGRWKGSSKRPDYSIQLTSAGGLWKDKWVIEAGFSQNYDSLKETARLWLEGMQDNQVEMVTLIHYEENPPYRCPLHAGKNPTTQGIPLDISDIYASHPVCTTPTGPVTYRDKIWVGGIVKVSMETWTRGANGKARQRDPAKDLLTEAELRIPVRDFLSAPYQGNIVIDLDLFRRWLPGDLQDQACMRAQTAVTEWHKRHGDDPRDRDYQPSGQGQGQDQG